MGRITGLEDFHQVPSKVLAMYEAVIQMLEEGVDAVSIRVSTITERAGIGKGTAYEYFDSKDEIVACAIVYYMGRFSLWLEEQLEARENFREQLEFLLDMVERKERCKSAFLRFVQMMVSNSEFNRMVREKVGAEEFAPYRPPNIFGKVLQRGVERGELRGDLPVGYMIYCIFSHLLSYMMELANGECFQVEPGAMRLLVYRGIVRELCGSEP